MSVPIQCAACSDYIGSYEPGFSENSHSNNSVCPGKGNHEKPERQEQKNFYGWVNHIKQSYPETGTFSTWHEYTGPTNKFCLWLAIVFGTGSRRRIYANGTWIWWNLGSGFLGDSAKALSQKS